MPIVDKPVLDADQPGPLPLEAWNALTPEVRLPAPQLAQLFWQLGLCPTGVPARQARLDFVRRLGGLDGQTARRLLQIWQVLCQREQDCPVRLHYHMAVTFLPSTVDLRFPVQDTVARLTRELGLPSQDLLCGYHAGAVSDVTEERMVQIRDAVHKLGHSWVDLIRARCLVMRRELSAITGQPRWVMKCYSFWIDDVALRLHVGGTQPHINGVHNHLKKTYDLVEIAGESRSSQTVCATDVALHLTGLDLHYAIEQAAMVNEGLVSELTFPRAWLGFLCDDNFQVEGTQEFRHDLLHWLRTWQARGRPAGYSVLLDDPSFTARLPRNSQRWGELERAIGKDLQVLSEHFFAETQARAGGLYFVPLDYFQAGSSQRPLERANKVVLQFPAQLMGREVHTFGSAEPKVDPLQARIQVRRLAHGHGIDEMLRGRGIHADYVFRAPRS